MFQFNMKGSRPADTCAVSFTTAKSHQTCNVAYQSIQSETTLISMVLDPFIP